MLSNYVEAVEGSDYLFDVGRLMPRYDEKERRIFTHSLVVRERDGQLSGAVFVAALAEDFDLTVLGLGKQLDALVYLTRKRFVSRIATGSRTGTSTSFSPPFRYVWPSELDLMARLAGMAFRERQHGTRLGLAEGGVAGIPASFLRALRTSTWPTQPRLVASARATAKHNAERNSLAFRDLE